MDIDFLRGYGLENNLKSRDQYIYPIPETVRNITNVDDRTEGKLLPKAWLFIFLLSIVGCLNYLDRIMITTMRTSIVDAIPMTDTQFRLLTSSFLWVYGQPL